MHKFPFGAVTPLHPLAAAGRPEHAKRITILDIAPLFENRFS